MINEAIGGAKEKGLEMLLIIPQGFEKIFKQEKKQT